MSYLNETLVGIVEAALIESEACEPSLGLEDGLDLKPKSVLVDEIGIDLVPESLRQLFTFRSFLGVSPKEKFNASCISISIFAMRLDAQGNMVHASPSIKNAMHSKESKFLPTGEWGQRTIVRPDFYLEADFFGDDDFVMAVPSIHRQPYPVESAAVTVQLSTANTTDPDFVELHNSARHEFGTLMSNLSEELSVPAGEQFLVCMIGFPQSTRAITTKEGKECWGASFEGGYIVGGRKISTSKKSLSPTLSSLKVSPSFMVGGKDLKTRIAEEMLRSRSARTDVQSPLTKLVKEVTTDVRKKDVLAASVSPSKAVAVTPVVEPVQSAMPSAGILSQLQTENDDEQDWEMLSLENSPENNDSVIEDQTTEYDQDMSAQEDELLAQEAVGTVTRRNPFAESESKSVVKEESAEPIGTVARRNPFA